MKDTICSQCGGIVPAGVAECPACGWNVANEIAAERYPKLFAKPQPKPKPLDPDEEMKPVTEPAPAPTDRFMMLRGFAVVLGTLAIIVPAILIAAPIVFCVTFQERLDAKESIIIIGIGAITALIVFAILKFVSELARWLVDVGDDIRSISENSHRP
jgi:hypothetical protein